MTTTHAFDPAEALILDEWSATDPAGSPPRVAILGSEDPAIAEVVAERAASVTIFPRQPHDPTAANPLPSNVTVSGRGARLARREKWGPPAANPTCGGGSERVTSKRYGSSKTRSSRFPEA